MRISGGLIKTLAGNLPALNSTTANAGSVVVVAGTLDLASFTANRGTTVAGGTFSVANGATLKIGGTGSFPGNYATHSLGVSSTVEYSGGNQTVTLESYGNLTLSASSGAVTKTMPVGVLNIAGNLASTAVAGSSLSFTAGGALTVSGNVSLGAGTTFNGNSFAHVITGNWTNTGTFNGNTGSVTLRGNGATVTGTGTNQFNNLTLAGAGLTAASNTALGLSGNFLTTGAGTFTHLTGGSGTVSMTGATKSIGGSGIIFNNLTVSGSIGTTSSFEIAGNLQVSGAFSASAGAVALSGAAKTVSRNKALTNSSPIPTVAFGGTR